MTLLQLIEYIVTAAKYLQLGSIRIGHDKLKVIQAVNNVLTKSSKFSLVGLATIIKIRQIRTVLKINIIIEYVSIK